MLCVVCCVGCSIVCMCWYMQPPLSHPLSHTHTHTHPHTQMVPHYSRNHLLHAATAGRVVLFTHGPITSYFIIRDARGEQPPGPPMWLGKLAFFMAVAGVVLYQVYGRGSQHGARCAGGGGGGVWCVCMCLVCVCVWCVYRVCVCVGCAGGVWCV